MAEREGAAPRRRLRLDPIACEGVGICAHLAADLVRVDSWGYPILAADPLARRTMRQATAAVTACPHRALFIQDEV
jgi:ferredoxin